MIKDYLYCQTTKLGKHSAHWKVAHMFILLWSIIMAVISHICNCEFQHRINISLYHLMLVQVTLKLTTLYVLIPGFQSVWPDFIFSALRDSHWAEKSISHSHKWYISGCLEPNISIYNLCSRVYSQKQPQWTHGKNSIWPRSGYCRSYPFHMW